MLDIFRCFQKYEEPNYLFQMPKTELSAHLIKLLSMIANVSRYNREYSKRDNNRLFIKITQLI